MLKAVANATRAPGGAGERARGMRWHARAAVGAVGAISLLVTCWNSESGPLSSQTASEEACEAIQMQSLPSGAAAPARVRRLHLRLRLRGLRPERAAAAAPDGKDCI